MSLIQGSVSLSHMEESEDCKTASDFRVFMQLIVFVLLNCSLLKPISFKASSDKEQRTKLFAYVHQVHHVSDTDLLVQQCVIDLMCKNFFCLFLLIFAFVGIFVHTEKSTHSWSSITLLR